MMRHAFFITVLVFAALTGCSTDQKPRNEKERESTDSSSLLKDSRITTEFTEDGIKLTYTKTGALESIEVTGIAESWRGETQARLLAEADAYEKLTKFTCGSTVKNSQRTKLLAKSLEIAKDKLKTSKSKDSDEINFTADELEGMDVGGGGDAASTSNSGSIRNASLINQITTSTITEITSKGKLRGVRKIKEFTRNGGKTFIAVYVWSDKDNTAAEQMRKKMSDGN